MTVKKMSKKKKDALIEKAYGKVGNGRPVPMMSLGSIWKAAEKAYAACEAFHLPLTEAEVIAAVEAALEPAIAAVEVKS